MYQCSSDLDLPPALRTEAKYWKKHYDECAKECDKYRRMSMRLKAQLSRAKKSRVNQCSVSDDASELKLIAYELAGFAEGCQRRGLTGVATRTLDIARRLQELCISQERDKKRTVNYT